MKNPGKVLELMKKMSWKIGKEFGKFLRSHGFSIKFFCSNSVVYPIYVGYLDYTKLFSPNQNEKNGKLKLS